jgi:hypothetical protein
LSPRLTLLVLTAPKSSKAKKHRLLKIDATELPSKTNAKLMNTISWCISISQQIGVLRAPIDSWRVLIKNDEKRTGLTHRRNIHTHDSKNKPQGSSPYEETTEKNPEVRDPMDNLGYDMLAEIVIPSCS